MISGLISRLCMRICQPFCSLSNSIGHMVVDCRSLGRSQIWSEDTVKLSVYQIYKPQAQWKTDIGVTENAFLNVTQHVLSGKILREVEHNKFTTSNRFKLLNQSRLEKT